MRQGHFTKGALQLTETLLLFLRRVLQKVVILPAGTTDVLIFFCCSKITSRRLNLDPNSKTSGQWNRVDPIYRYVTFCFRLQHHVYWKRRTSIYFAAAFKHPSTPAWDFEWFISWSYGWAEIDARCCRNSSDNVKILQIEHFEKRSLSWYEWRSFIAYVSIIA